MNKIGLLLIGGAVFFEIIADIILKYWSINPKTIFVVCGIIVYTIGTTMFAYSLRFGDLSKMGTIFTVVNLIVVVLIGLLLFKEQVSLINMIGIFLGVISVILVQL